MHVILMRQTICFWDSVRKFELIKTDNNIMKRNLGEELDILKHKKDGHKLMNTKISLKMKNILPYTRKL